MPLTPTLTFVWDGKPAYFNLVPSKVMPDSQKEWNSAVQRFITYGFLQITLKVFNFRRSHLVLKKCARTQYIT